MKSLIFAGTLCFVFGNWAVNAQGLDLQETSQTTPANAKTGDGPTFTVEKNGLILFRKFSLNSKKHPVSHFNTKAGE
jgi:hypothetical protein